MRQDGQHVHDGSENHELFRQPRVCCLALESLACQESGVAAPDTYIHTYICIHIRTPIHIHIHRRICIHTNIFFMFCIYTKTYMYVCVCMCVCVHMYVYMVLYICMYIYIYIYRTLQIYLCIYSFFLRRGFKRRQLRASGIEATPAATRAASVPRSAVSFNALSGLGFKIKFSGALLLL